MDHLRIRQLLAEGDGVLVRREHPELAGQLDWLLRTGALQPVLPGVYAPAERAELPLTRMVAACRAHPDAVLTGAAAARLTFWPSAPLSDVDVAVPRKLRPQPGFRFARRGVPADLVAERSTLRCTVPALTAIELADLSDANAIDVALRGRWATLDGMREALRCTPHRAGNSERLSVLLDSRDEPWSEAERQGHRLLRQGRITGWRTNVPVVVEGRLYYVDIAFARERLALEIDGRIHEQDLELFESDRWRQNALVRAGWRVLRFTWSMLVEHPAEVIAQVRAALRSTAGSSLGVVQPLR